MIENMKVEFGRTSDIDSWMRLVRKVSWNFPGSTGILIYYPIQGLNIRMPRIPRCTITFFQ